MLSMGYPKDKLDTIANGEVAELLAKGDIIYPSYNEVYFDGDVFYSELKQSQDNLVKYLKEDLQLTDSEVDLFFQKQWNINEYDKDSVKGLKEELEKNPAKL